MKPLLAVNYHGTAGCLSVETVTASLRYSQSCFLCIVSTANYWLDGNCCKVQTVQSEQWPPNVQPQLQSTRQKLPYEDVRLTSHSISELQCHTRTMFSSRKQAYFTFPWGKNVIQELFKCVHTRKHSLTRRRSLITITLMSQECL